MKKFKGSTSVDCLYMESMLNKQMRSNIRMIQNRILIPMQITPKPLSQIEQRKIATNDYPIFRQQDINELIVLTYGYPFSQSCIDPKFKRSCIHLDNGQIVFKHSHYLKKGGQSLQTTQQTQETKPWHPFIRMKRKKLIQNFLQSKLTQDSQPIQGVTSFQPIVDLSGWQTQEEPQIEIQ